VPKDEIKTLSVPAAGKNISVFLAPAPMRQRPAVSFRRSGSAANCACLWSRWNECSIRRSRVSRPVRPDATVTELPPH
jgi:hypothetical protein